MTSKNPLLASSQQVEQVTVEFYAGASKYGMPRMRHTRTFTGPGAVAASRKFYAAQLHAGNEPRVVAAKRVGE